MLLQDARTSASDSLGNSDTQEHTVVVTSAAVPPQDLFPAAVAADMILWRQQLLVDLEHQGVITVDAFPCKKQKPWFSDGDWMRITGTRRA